MGWLIPGHRRHGPTYDKEETTMLLPHGEKKQESSFQEFLIRLPMIPLALFVTLVVLLFPFVPLLILVYWLGKLMGF